jgi:hypothetical protein
MGGGMMGGAMMGELGLLQRNDVRKELELLDDQIAELEKIDAGAMMRSAFEGVPREEMRDRMPQILEDTRKKIQKEIDKVLLPHQATRLSQLAVRASMRSAMGLVRGDVADKLGLSEQDREQLGEKARKIQEELQKEAVERLINELPAAKREKLKQLMGKDFTFQDEPRRERPRGAFGRQRGD